MSSQPSGSKRKQPVRPFLNNLLHPGEWRGKRAWSTSRPGSPSASGASSPGTQYSGTPAQYNTNSRSPSPMRDPEPSPPSQSSQGTTAPIPLSNPNDQTPRPITGTSNLDQNRMRGAWTGLEKALRALSITTKICPPLASAIDDLASCLPEFEGAARNRSDYEDLATDLKSMVDQLDRHLGSTTSEDVIASLTGIAKAIRKEMESIAKYQSGLLPHRRFGPSSIEEDLIRRYRRIEQLFRQVHGEASMNTWSAVDELRMEQYLKDLYPAKLARFDSELSIEVSRRSCTKDTRTKILDDSIAWSEDPGQAKIYWMNGMAGTGKTTIAYSFCERLKARGQLAASFFCTRASAECREAKRIIPTIAYQLARRFSPFRSSLFQQLKQDRDINTSQISSQFSLLLKEPLIACSAKYKLPNNLVIVIDALDECSDPHVVELFLGLLFRSVMELPVKIFVTSRPEPAIRNRMMPESEHARSILYLHEIEQSLVQADIELYLREELACISPEDADIKELAEYAGNLFIYAATAVRYIRPLGKAVNSKARLAAILELNSESHAKLSAIDGLYTAVLTAAINDQGLERQEQDQIRLVLWTAVSVYEPILVQTLSTLSGINNQDDIMAALEPVRSVLHVSDRSGLVTTLHASFPDYMFSQERSGSFYCNKVTHGQLLAKQCFKIIKAQLRFNICSIQSSFIPDDRIPDLSERIDKNISPELYYASRFWVDHLSEASPHDDLLLLARDFLFYRLLFWMEVLNLKKCLAIGVVSTTKLNTWLSQVHAETNLDLLKLASDAHRFISSHAPSPASTHTPHIYLSSLPLSPLSSAVRSCYLSRFRGLIKVSGTIFERLDQAALSTWASNGSIRSATFSPASDYIILGDEKGRISVQNAYDGKYVVQPFKAHKKIVTSLGVSNDGTQIVSGSYDMTISVWAAYDGTLISGPFKGHTNRVTSVAFSSDSAYVVSGSDDRTVGIWDPRNVASPMRSFAGHKKGVTSVAFAPDGTCVISGSVDHTIRLWNLSSGATILTLQGHRASVTSVQFSPDGAHIISGSHDRTIRIWNTCDGTLLSQPLQGHSKRIESIAVSSDGNRIVSGSTDHTVRVWDRHSGELIAGPFEGHTDSVRSVGFSADSTRILSASDDKTVQIWSLKGRMTQTRNTPKKGFRWIVLPNMVSSLDQTHVAFSDSRDSTALHVWDLRTMRHIDITTSAEIRYIQLSSDGTCVHSLHTTGDLYTWNTQTAALLSGPHRYSTYPELFTSYSTVCSDDGTRAITFYQDKTELWHVRSNHCITLPRIQAYTDSPRISRDGSRILVRSAPPSDTIEVWDGNSGARVAGPLSLGRVYNFSPDGKYICYSQVEYDGFVNLIDVDSQAVTRIQLNSRLKSAKLSSDGLYIASAFVVCYTEETATIRIWSIHSRAFITEIKVAGDIEKILEVSSDGRILLYGETKRGENGYHICRIHKDDPSYTMSPDGWILDNQRCPQFWVPTEIRETFPMSSRATVFAGDVIQSVDYNDMLVGDDWSKCYIGD